MSEIAIFEQNEIGNGLIINNDTKKLELNIDKNTFGFDEHNKLIAKPQSYTPTRDKFQIEITNNNFSVSNKWDYYAYVLDFHNGMGIFHLRITARNEFNGQDTLGQFPATCLPADLFEIKDEEGLVDIWADPNDRTITISSKNTLAVGTRLDFHNVISLN